MAVITKLGKYLKEWRANNKLSLDEASEVLYINRNTINGYELGRTEPSYTIIKTIHDITGADWEDLF